MENLRKELIQKLFQQAADKSVDNQKIFGMQFCVKQNDILWNFASGDISNSDKFFIASTTKLFVTAIILILVGEGKISLEDKILKFFAPNFLDGLHIYGGVDYSNNLEIHNLLAHTSGLPDYLTDSMNGEKLLDKLLKGNDMSWDFETVIKWTKSKDAHFAPNSKGKAYYSDSNFQILGKIIEKVESDSFENVCQRRILSKLEMANTYMYKVNQDTRTKDMHYKNNILSIPKAMASFWVDGGMVSNSSDLMKFITSFFEGKLFDRSKIESLMKWNNIFFPLQSGIGIHRFKLPWYFDPFSQVPEFLGHSGLSGTVAYFAPKENIYICGTVNQLAYNDLSFKKMIGFVNILKSNK